MSVSRTSKTTSERAKAGLYDVSLSWASHLTDLASVGLKRLPLDKRYLPSDAITLPLARMWTPKLRIIERNYAIMLGVSETDPVVHELAVKSIRNWGRMAIDFLTVRTMTFPEILAWGDDVGADFLDQALEEKRGLIFALPHAGSWDVAAAFAQAWGLKLTIITEDNWANSLVTGSRTNKGLTIAPRGRGLRQVFRALSRNEIVAILSDIVHENIQTINVQFFGHPAPFPTGAARIAVRTGTPVMVVSSFRQPNHRYRLEARPVIRPPESVPEDEAVYLLTEQMAHAFESVIRQYPDQWYPFQPVWPELFRNKE